jgi:type II secretion system protein N
MFSVKTLCAYLTFAMLAAVIFMYLLFPDQAINAYLDGRLAAIDPALSMQAEAIRPAIPPGIKMTGIDLEHDGLRLARFGTARISPDLATVLQDEKQVRFQAQLAEGAIMGRAAMADAGPAGLVRAEADLSDIRLDQLDAVKALSRFTLSGYLKGRLTHDGGRAPTGVTSGLLTATALRITLKTPVFGIADILLDQTDADFSASGRNLRIKSLTFNGPLVEGKISGAIELRQPFAKSRLNLTGNAKPKPELVARLQETLPQDVVNMRQVGTRGLTFRIRGAVDNPNWSMR